MRASDADRQAVADRLKVALDEGRLSLDEYDDRVQWAHAAKTYGELRGLLTDLPTTELPLPLPAPIDQDNLTRRWLVSQWKPYAQLVGVMGGIWLAICVAIQDLVVFWPLVIVGPIGVAMVWLTVSGLASGEPLAWQARAEQEEREKLAATERPALERSRCDPTNERPFRRSGHPVWCHPWAGVHWLAGAQRPLLHVLSASRTSGSRGWSELSTARVRRC